MFGFFIVRKLFDISYISDHVQPNTKPPSVVLAESGHFVATWSVQDSCGHLVSAGPPCMFIQPHWSQQNEAQKQTRNFYIKVTFNTAIQCSSKML